MKTRRNPTPSAGVCRAARRLPAFFFIVALSPCLAASAPAAEPEELRLRNGNVLKGQFVEGDKQTIVFRTSDGLQSFPKKDVRAILFEGDPAPEGEFPPGFSAVAPLKIKRVITYRRVTQNRAVEEKQFEPEVITVSGDGSKIVCWNPKSGFWSMNADGSNRKQVLAVADNSDRFRAEWGGRIALSHDGRVLYWQGYQSAPIRRINTDGTDERLLVRAGAEYTPLQLREACGRIFFSQRGGIFSIDTEGKGDYREIVTNLKLGKLWEVSSDVTMLGAFDVSADGQRIAFVVSGFPKTKGPQLLAMNADGSGMRRLAETDFAPTALTMSPDGSQILFWKYGETAYVAGWEGGGVRKLDLPPWDANGSGFQHLNRFSPDGKWFMYNGNEGGGFVQLTQLDGSGRYEPMTNGPWHHYENALFHGMYSPTFTADLRRSVTISQYWRQFKPRQVVVTDINPRTATGLPALADIEFADFLSTNPQVPQHRVAIKVRVTKGASDVERVHFQLIPMAARTRSNDTRWHPNLGWDALQGDHLLRDDGKNGDAKAGDGIFSSDALSPHPTDYRPVEGRYLLRLVAHDDQNAVAVDVDGVEIK
ncbi:MAG: choice-of-anchor X domain-containing protein [Verrucomicrobiota bacterium]